MVRNQEQRLLSEFRFLALKQTLWNQPTQNWMHRSSGRSVVHPSEDIKGWDFRIPPLIRTPEGVVLKDFKVVGAELICAGQ